MNKEHKVIKPVFSALVVQSILSDWQLWVITQKERLSDKHRVVTSICSHKLWFCKGNSRLQKCIKNRRNKRWDLNKESKIGRCWNNMTRSPTKLHLCLVWSFLKYVEKKYTGNYNKRCRTQWKKHKQHFFLWSPQRFPRFITGIFGFNDDIMNTTNLNQYFRAKPVKALLCPTKLFVYMEIQVTRWWVCC